MYSTGNEVSETAQEKGITLTGEMSRYLHGCDVKTRSAQVALLVNGVKVGEKAMKKDCMAKFTCTYQDDTITAISYEQSGKELGRCTLKTASPETMLRLEPEVEQVRPGQLCYVRLRYTDEEGITKPLQRGVVQVKVEGGQLLGLGSGCPFQTRSFLGQETDTYYGEALAVVQAQDPGQMRVEATDGCYTAHTVIPVGEGKTP